jgi:hypothetical protein
MKMNEAELVKMAKEWAESCYTDKELNPNDPYALVKQKNIRAVAAHGFYFAYNMAQAIVEEELHAVQAQRGERPGLGSAEYALKNVLSKMRSK